MEDTDARLRLAVHVLDEWGNDELTAAEALVMLRIVVGQSQPHRNRIETP